MRILCLGSTESWYLKDLQRAAGERHEVVPATFRQLHSEISECGLEAGSGSFDATTADCILVRTMPRGSLEQVVFRMDALGRLQAGGLTIINPPRAIEIAVDKFLATAKLQAAGLTVPRTACCQTVDEAMSYFEQLKGSVVVKPLFGGEGRGITRLDDEALALRAFTMLEQLGAVIYLQEFVPHEGRDLRVLVIGDRVFAVERRNPHDWRTNVSRGATMQPVEVTPELADTARRAAQAVETPFAGVDLLPGKNGQLYAVEVNAVPGWRALGRALNMDIARVVLKYLESLD
ncbi:MAG: RimK family alpha-L-glutamate ligase [Planctomycetota bacterium]|nr:RimK family alpha-L-glutamate ligase [Planctomycetota bacterium]